MGCILNNKAKFKRKDCRPGLYTKLNIHLPNISLFLLPLPLFNNLEVCVLCMYVCSLKIKSNWLFHELFLLIKDSMFSLLVTTGEEDLEEDSIF